MYVSPDAVSDAIRSNNEPKNHDKCGGAEPDMTSRAARGSLWLIARHENGRTEIFTVHPGSHRETLPIFSHEEEAEMFLWLDAPGAGWRARETTAESLVSLLYGTCVGVGEVALDPLPLFDHGAMAGLVSLLREDFVRNLIDEREPQASRQGSFERGMPGAPGFSGSFERRRA